MELADYAAESVILYDLEGAIRYSNQACASLYGWPSEVLAGRSFASLCCDQEDEAAVWPELLEQGQWRGLVRRRTSAAQEIVASVRLAIRRTPAGEPLDVVEYSDRAPPEAIMVARPGRQAEARRRLAHSPCWQFNIARARPLLEHAAQGAGADPLWHQDRLDRALDAVRTLDINDAAIRLFGLVGDRDRLVARSVTSLWPEQSCAVLADLLTALATGEVEDTETRQLGALGPLTDVMLTGWHSGCSDTVFVCISGTMNPSSAVLELEASQDRYRNLISSLPLPVWEVDARPAGRIFDRLRANGVTDMDAYSKAHPDIVDITCGIVMVTDVNRQAIELLGGRDKAQLIGPVAYVFEGTPGSGRRVMLAHFAGVRNYVEEFKVRTLDGRLLDVLLLMTFPIPGERLDTTLIMMVDNTSRLQTEAKLRQLEADFQHAARLSTLGEMTASIAHEIKQPLSAILTNAETSLRWLTRDEPNVPKATQLTDRIGASARRASDIIERIQDMAGKREPVRIQLDLNEVVRQALVFVRHDSDEKSIRVRLALDEDLPPVMGDRVQLQQIVVNLLVNSIQAMRLVEPDHRDIEVTTTLDGSGMIALSVRDTGTGIPQNDLERVFDGFFSTKSDGMGIGLAICQSIVTAHGGAITAANHPDGGAVFRVTVPAASSLVARPSPSRTGA